MTNSMWLSIEIRVALRKESVDRNLNGSLAQTLKRVALRKESVDRNWKAAPTTTCSIKSLSARRAWIEMPQATGQARQTTRRSPQGERG